VKIGIYPYINYHKDRGVHMCIDESLGCARIMWSHRVLLLVLARSTRVYPVIAASSICLAVILGSYSVVPHSIKRHPIVAHSGINLDPRSLANAR